MRRMLLASCAVIALVSALALSPQGAHAQTFTARPAHSLNTRVAAHPATALSADCPECDGQDPFTYLDPNGIACAHDQAKTVSGTDVPYGEVLNVYSYACGTNWAITIQNNSSYIANANITRADGEHYDGTWYGSFVYSPMVYAPYLAAQACGSINNAPGGCSAWV